MPLPTPDNTINWTAIIEISVSISAAVFGWIYFVNAYFKNKATEKRNWIESIATIAVKEAMKDAFKDVRADIDTLFKYREEDRKHIDHKFETVMTEMRKK